MATVTKKATGLAFSTDGFITSTSKSHYVNNPQYAVDDNSETYGEFAIDAVKSRDLFFFGFDFYSYFSSQGLTTDMIQINSVKVSCDASAGTMLTGVTGAFTDSTLSNGLYYHDSSGNSDKFRPSEVLYLIKANQSRTTNTIDITSVNIPKNWLLNSHDAGGYCSTDNQLKSGYVGIVFSLHLNNLLAWSSQYVKIRELYITLDYSILNYTLTLNKSGDGTVSGGGSFAPGSSVTITATANSHSHFVRWSDGNTNATRTITLSSDTTLTAYFEKDKHTLTLTAGTGGTVSGGGTFDYGTSHTVTATANTGWHFVKWSDGNTNASRTVTVTQNTTLTAEFAKNSYTISTSSNAGGVVQGGGTFEFGSSVTLTAVSSSPNTFVRWSDGVTSEQRTVTVNGNASYKAIFGQFRPQITGCSLIYNGEQITENNKVPTNEGYIISVNVVDNLTEN